MKLDPIISIIRTGEHETIRFGKGTTIAKGFIIVRTPIREIKF
jgi:hypothetical protein